MNTQGPGRWLWPAGFAAALAAPACAAAADDDVDWVTKHRERYEIAIGGHSWPGSEFSAGIDDVVGPTTFSIDADQVMWDFFVAHPRR